MYQTIGRGRDEDRAGGFTSLGDGTISREARNQTIDQVRAGMTAMIVIYVRGRVAQDRPIRRQQSVLSRNYPLGICDPQ